MNESSSNEPRGSCLPEHLRFVVDLPDLGSMEREEKIEFFYEHVRKLRHYKEELSAYGIDADAIAGKLEAAAKELEEAERNVQKGEDALLHAHADLADRERELFQLCEKALEQAEEENPFHPKVQEWREQVEELRKNYPKE